MNFKNTLQKGNFRYIIFMEDSVWYAVALEFNLVITANDPKVAMLEMFQAVEGYVESVKKSNSRPFALNQVTEKEYENMWTDLNAGKLIPSPFTVFNFGVTAI